MDPRHAKRIRTIQNLFAYSFPHLKDETPCPTSCNGVSLQSQRERNPSEVPFKRTKEDNLPYKHDELTQDIILHIADIDTRIGVFATKFTIDKMAKVDLAILRLAVYELIHAKEPIKVVINEAVELAKEFGGDKSYTLINGVLGKITSLLQKTDEKT